MDFFSAYPPELRAICEWLRRMVAVVAPEAKDGWRLKPRLEGGCGRHETRLRGFRLGRFAGPVQADLVGRRG